MSVRISTPRMTTEPSIRLWEERIFGLINSLTGLLTVLMAPRPSRDTPSARQLGSSTDSCSEPNNVCQLSCNLRDSSVAANGHSVCEEWRVLGNFLCRDVVPNGQYHLATKRLPCDQSVEFILRPSLGEERVAEHNNPKSRIGQSAVDAF